MTGPWSWNKYFCHYIVFEIYVSKDSLGMPDHAHLKLDDQFVALIDMKLHAQNQLYTSISF